MEIGSRPWQLPHQGCRSHVINAQVMNADLGPGPAHGAPWELYAVTTGHASATLAHHHRLIHGEIVNDVDVDIDKDNDVEFDTDIAIDIDVNIDIDIDIDRH